MAVAPAPKDMIIDSIEVEQATVRTSDGLEMGYRKTTIGLRPVPFHYKIGAVICFFLPKAVRNHGVFDPHTEPVNTNVKFQWYDVPAVTFGESLTVFQLLATGYIILWYLEKGLLGVGILSFILFVAYLLVAAIVAVVFTKKEYGKDGLWMFLSVLLATIRLLPFIRAGQYIYHGLQSRRSDIGEETRREKVPQVEIRHRHLAEFNMAEAVLETFIQIILVLITIFMNDTGHFELFSDQGRTIMSKVFLGWLRVSWRMTCLQAAIRNKNKKAPMALKHKICSTFYRACETGIAILCLSYCFTREVMPIVLLIGFLVFRTFTYHWCIVVSTRSDHIGRGLSVLVAIIYNFGFINLGTGRSRGVAIPYYMFLYYPFYFLLLMVVSNYTQKYDDRLFFLTFLIIALGLLHLPSLLTYFRCCHPNNSNVKLCIGCGELCKCRDCYKNVCPRPKCERLHCTGTSEGESMWNHIVGNGCVLVFYLSLYFNMFWQFFFFGSRAGP